MSLMQFRYYRNRLSMAGLLLAFLFGALHLTLFMMDLLSPVPNPYMSIWLYIVLPPFVVTGLALALAGAWWSRRRSRRRGASEEEPSEKLKTWKTFVLSTGIAALLLIPFVAVTSYEGYSFTESVAFCGLTCHEPMKPSYTAYQHSPHARVACANCHIGEGASWFVRSKLSGVRQVFATYFDSFHRPIETPIKSLRPARETCERCHWPEMDFGDRVVKRVHFACDEKNTRRPLIMELHTGGGDPGLSEVTGIHWHVTAQNRVEYVAVDEDRMELPWVKVTTPEGETVYRSDGLSADAPPPDGERRTLDCIDCHNRPTHRFQPPDQALDRFFSLGLLDAELPYLKREAARLMAARYEDEASAQTAIQEGLRRFYEENYPEIASAKADSIAGSTEYVIQAFNRNLFPEMKTDWRVDPDHIGHKYSPGCFRCHEGRHVASNGTAIVHDCGACHDFLVTERIGEAESALVRQAYEHPFPLEKAHQDLSCPQCHQGGPMPRPVCEDCHADISRFRSGKPALVEGVQAIADPMADLECLDCHEGPQAFSPEEIPPFCAGCHEGEEVDSWLNELDSFRRMAEESEVGQEMKEALNALRRLRPIHNLPYAENIYRHIEKTAGAKTLPGK